jgi:hypothetical protein
MLLWFFPLIIMILFMELPARSSFGKFLSMNDCSDFIHNRYIRNSYNEHLIIINDRYNSYIAKYFSLDFLYAKYFIQGRGRVLRWGKLSKHIDNMFERCKMREEGITKGRSNILGYPSKFSCGQAVRIKIKSYSREEVNIEKILINEQNNRYLYVIMPASESGIKLRFKEEDLDYSKQYKIKRIIT